MSGGGRAIRVLLVEDSPDDAELIELELRTSDYQPRVLRVETLEQFARELDAAPWDIVLADYALPGFTGTDALRILKRSRRDIPFILVSGTIGEEAAVELMKAGAQDFFLKDRLTRLGSAIERELREAACRRERRAATTLLDNLYESAPIGLACLDCSFRYVRINETLAAMNGLPVAEHLGRTVGEVVPALAPASEEICRAILSNGQPALNVEMIGETRAAPGKARHWLMNYYPVRDKEGALIGIGSIVVETTDLKRAEKALRESEARKSAILASAFDGVVAFDEGCRVVEFNQAAERMFGYSRDRALGKDVTDLLTSDGLRSRYREGVRRCLESGEGSVIGRVVEMLALRADGSEFPVELAITIVEEQSPRVFTGFIRDISERKRASVERDRLLAELEHAVRARDEFLSIASHELKTPITTLELQVASGLQLLGTKGNLENAREKLVSKMEAASRQVQRLTGLVNNLLQVTQVTGDQRPPARKQIDLRDVVHAVLTRLHPVLERCGAQVALRADSPVVGSWDPAGLETVASNLISNALKYGEGKPIEVCVERDGERARLVVTDLGVGIASEDQKRIFQCFERAVPSQHYGGFGLGLWIARNIVEAHDGWIRVSSQAGAGSTFTVELPLGRG